jgi:hypothetical protein
MNPAASGSVYDTTRLEGESTLYVQTASEREEEQPSTTDTFTIDDAFVHLGFGPAQIFVFLFCGLAWAGDGMEMMLLGFLGPEVQLISSI